MALKDYQVNFIVHSGSGMDNGRSVYLNGHSLSWPNDMRFTNDEGDTLEYWIESYDADAATVWVKVDNIPASPGVATIKLYYGKSGDAGASDGNATFPFFDDFNAGPVDTSKWAISTAGGSVTGLAGLVILSANNGQNARMTSATSFAGPMVIGTRFEPIMSNSMGVRDRFSSSNVLQNPFSYDTGIFNIGKGGGLEMFWDGATNPPFNINTFYTSEETFIPGKSVKWTVYGPDRAVIYNNIASTSKTSYKPDYGVGDFPVNNGEFGYMTLDWAYVRNYTANEPTSGTWSTEIATQSASLFWIMVALIVIILGILAVLLLAAMFIFGFMAGKRKK